MTWAFARPLGGTQRGQVSQRRDDGEPRVMIGLADTAAKDATAVTVLDVSVRRVLTGSAD
nr:hypothetical protein [Kibdelosporangium sp. MJ126-NF4]